MADLGIKLQPGTQIYQINVEDLRPTQLCVGMQQVHEKMKKLQKKAAKGPEALDKFLRNHPVPVVLGPSGRHFLIDHHHLARAMHELGIKQCYAGTVLDLSELTPEQFWVAMGKRNLLWRFMSDGSPIEVQELSQRLPNRVAELADDPYRSLAALVRKAGGYTKSTKPFSEFIWANYLRPRIPMVLVQVPDVEAYVHHGISHAVHPDAAALPGFTLLEKADAQRLDLMSNLGKADDDDKGGK